MTTRLSQRRVKSGDPAYLSLKEEMQARIWGQGADYVIPVGGIPRSDMTLDVQEALDRAERSYVLPHDGISIDDLSLYLADAIEKAIVSYEKPITGIPMDDLSEDIQLRLQDFSNFYILPSTGIPYVDLDIHTRGLLDKAESAYQKPEGGVPIEHLHQNIQEILDLALSAYQLKETGVEWDELSIDIKDKIEEIQNNIDDVRQEIDQAELGIITDHNKLSNTGKYTHPQLDKFVDHLEGSVRTIHKELVKARSGFEDLDRRISSTLMRDGKIIIEDFLFEKGTFENLILSDDHHITFPYTNEPFPFEFYDLRTSTGYESGNYLATREYDELDIRWPNEILTFEGVPLSNDVGLLLNGWLYAPTTGRYQFAIQGSQDLELKVGNASVQVPYSINPVFNEAQLTKILTVDLVGGQFYKFILHGKNRNATGSHLRVSWKRPGRHTFSVIHKDYFSIDGFNSETRGVYTTDIIDTKELLIKQWAVHLTTDYKFWDDDIVIETRTSEDKEVFTEWTRTEPSKNILETPLRYMQIRITMNRTRINQTPIIQQIVLSYLSAKNNFFKEMIDARGDYIDLKDHLDSLSTSIHDVYVYASNLNNSGIDTAWLENVRFTHLDINMLRMHWYQLKETKQSAHILPTGIVDDYHDDEYVDPSSSAYEIIDSKIKPNPITEVYDTDADWLEWDRHHLAPLNGGLQLTFLKNDDVSQAEGEEIINTQDTTEVTRLTVPYQSGSVVSNYYQPFYVDPNDYFIKDVTVMVYTSRPTSAFAQVQIKLMSSLPDGTPNTADVLSRTFSNLSGNTVKPLKAVFDKAIPYGMTKWFIGVSYSGGNAAWPVSRSENIPSQNFNSPDNTPQFMLNQNFNKTIYMAKMSVVVNKGYYSEGEAQRIIDFGRHVQFVDTHIEYEENGGSIIAKYSTSRDGTTYSDVYSNLLDAPSGRYVKVHLTITRTDTNLSPVINEFKIRYYDSDFIMKTKSIEVSRIPSHAILDIEDSKNGDFTYSISRDRGHTFKEVTPGITTDLRDLPAGKEMVIKAHSDRSKQDDDVWIDYLGLQTITQEEFSHSNIVSHHQEVIAKTDQIEFEITKPYFMGDHSLEVYVNGSLQSLNRSYEETNETTITFYQPMKGGEIIVFRVAAGAYPFELGEQGDFADLITINNRLYILEQSISKINDDIDLQEDTLSSIEDRLSQHEFIHSSLLSEMQSLDEKINQVESSMQDELMILKNDLDSALLRIESIENLHYFDHNDYTETREYDEIGRLSKVTYYDDENIYMVEYEYDEIGRETVITEYQNSIITTTTFTYDEHDRISKKDIKRTITQE